MESKAKVALEPSCINRPRAAVEAQLNRSLYMYSDELTGVPVAYTRVEFTPNQHARILNDTPWVHVEVSTTMTVFKPQEGDLIMGKVAFVTGQSIALLCHGIFNASISAKELTRDGRFTYSEDKESWESDNAVIAEGDMMTFRIKMIYSNKGIISMAGAPCAE